MLGDRWGVSEDEVAQVFPCDRFVPAPAVSAWRGVDVAAPPAAVWPWVAQVRLAPYSYDLVDNLGRRSPRALQGLPEPVVGEPFTRAFGRPQGEVVDVEPGVSMTGRLAGAHLSYVVAPTPAGTSRILLKLVTAGGRRVGPLLCVGDLVMARKQLLTLARLAEG